MQYYLSSTLLLTILLAIGLIFFLRAASKDRTTVVEVFSSLPALEVLDGITSWLELRGWRSDGGDIDKKVLKFTGYVSSSKWLAIFLSLLGGLGACSLGLVISQIFPFVGYWPLLLSLVGAPLAGLIYKNRSSRSETLEMRLINQNSHSGCAIRLRAHRDELIALEIDLSKTLKLKSDGKLLTSPI
tara:strand:- start:2389 stop:2946 length:558 start_codon:yes stop_codon:yes gene_type:complete